MEDGGRQVKCPKCQPGRLEMKDYRRKQNLGYSTIKEWAVFKCDNCNFEEVVG